jgi:hypothetical protein
MKSTKSFLGLAVLLLAIIALVLTGCSTGGDGGDADGGGSGSDGGGGHGGDLALPSTNGLLTVTGLSAYNGKYIGVQAVLEDGDGQRYLYGMAGVNGTATEQIPIGTLISGGQAAIKIYEAETNPLDLNNIKGYSGSDTVQILAYITTTKTLSTSASYEEPVAAGYAQVSFQNGKATATFEFHAPQPVDDDDGGAVTEAAASVPR